MGLLTLSMSAGASILTEGCSESQVMTDIEHWAPVGKTAFDNIVTVLIEANVIPLGVPAKALIDDLFDQLRLDAAAYLAINPPPVGALQNVQATFVTILNNLQAFLAGLNLPIGSLLNLIVMLAQIIFSTIAGFETDLPASMTLLKGTLHGMVGTEIRVSQRSFKVVAQHRTNRSFKKDWNAVARAAGHPKTQIKLSFFERF